jgi:hypothetical protein
VIIKRARPGWNNNHLFLLIDILILFVLYNESVKAPFLIKLAGSATFDYFQANMSAMGQ